MNEAQKFMKNWLETPESREKWVEEKSKELHDKLWPEDKCKIPCTRQMQIREFLQSLVKEMPAKKMTVTEEFVKKWADVIHQADTALFGIKGELKLVRQMLAEAGVEVIIHGRK